MSESVEMATSRSPTATDILAHPVKSPCRSKTRKAAFTRHKGRI